MLRLATAMVLFAIFPFAAAAEESCNTAASTPGAKVLIYGLGADAAGDATGGSILYGFDRQALTYFPDLHGDDAACRIASLTVGGVAYYIAGDDASVVPRRTRLGQKNHRNAYLVATLKPDTVVRISHQLGESGARVVPQLPPVEKAELVYLLVAGSGDEAEWQVYGFYDAIPDTPRLALAMCAAILGKLPVVTVYNRETKEQILKQDSTATTLDAVAPDPACTPGPP